MASCLRKRPRAVQRAALLQKGETGMDHCRAGSRLNWRWRACGTSMRAARVPDHGLAAGAAERLADSGAGSFEVRLEAAMRPLLHPTCGQCKPEVPQTQAPPLLPWPNLTDAQVAA